MIKRETENGIVHTYSDAGLKIQRRDSKFPVNNAFEEEGKEHEWEEVTNGEDENEEGTD